MVDPPVTRPKRQACSNNVLSASSAHEINQPLDALLNLLYILESETGLSDIGRHYLALAQEEVHRIAKIARNDLNEHKGSADPIRVADQLERVIEIYKSRFESRGLVIHTRYRGKGECSIYAGQLRQIFSNLLLNAADAMQVGGLLQVRTHDSHEYSNNGRTGIRITIADSGSGIPAPNVPRIFDPFFTTKGPKGGGMGLWVVKDLLEKHNGSLKLRTSTQAGRSGTIFSIFLPSHSGS